MSAVNAGYDFTFEYMVARLTENGVLTNNR